VDQRRISGVIVAAAFVSVGLTACGKAAPSTARGGDGGGDAGSADGAPAEVGEAALASLYRSGSRLKARYIDAGGGARKFEGWYDTQLAAPCTFQLAEDGVMRCAPMSDSVGSGVDFADPGCSTPISYLPGSAFEAPYFVSETSRTYPATCPKNLAELNGQRVDIVVEVWRIGGPRSVPAATYFREGGGSCVMRSPSDLQTVYSVEKVQPSEMVSATTHVEPRGAALAVTVFEAEDGARMLGSLFDVKELQPCVPSWVWTASGDYRCYPSAPPRAPGNSPSCGATTLCDGDLTIGYGAPCGLASLHLSSTCEMVDSTKSPSMSSDLLGTGAVKLVVTRAADDPRPLFVNPPLWSAAGTYRPGPFVDTATNRSCDAVMIDGALRCVPTDTPIAQTYADAACTQLVLRTPDPASMSCGGAPAQASRFAIGGAPTHVYRIGNAAHLDQAWRKGLLPDGACVELEAPVDVNVLAPEDASTFPTLTSGRE
jgi:hypothetical protein